MGQSYENRIGLEMNSCINKFFFSWNISTK